MKKLLALILAAVMCVAMVACGGGKDNIDAGNVAGGGVVDGAYELKSIANKVYGEDYTALYEQFGKEVTIADVKEDTDTGFAYIEKDGTKYTLGLDFLSMAMVYNCQVPEGSSYESADEVYATWWKYYIQRWNYMLPEIPLYSNEYYDLYNAAITGVQENPTNPYWGPANALIDWASTKDDNSIIIGNSTDLSGKFRYASFGGSNPGAADNDIAKLTIGLDTVTTNKEGGYCWNDTVVKSHSEEVNEDGSKTYTIEIYDDMTFSDGSPVTAKDYLASTLAFSTPVGVAAAGKDHMAGMTIVGYDEFATYDGTEGSGSKALSGLRLLGDYTFSVTIDKEFLPYFYDIGYAGFSAQYRAMWLGEADVADDGEGCYLTDAFYAKGDDGVYTMAAHIQATAANTDTTYPYSGPYVVTSYDASTLTATLELNPNFKGNYEGTKPSIGKVIYKKVVDTTQMEDFLSGNLDLIAGITGGDATNEAIATADGSDGKYAYIHYSRAGYGKLGFRADYGPAQFIEVRQAIAYCMDRSTFAKDFTGGFGGVVDGPYYKGSWMYKAAVEQGMVLNAYATSADSAIEILKAGGWNYDKDGNAYVEGIRYKKIAAADATENDINYKSMDGAYATTKVGEDYYMPLVLNWYGTSNNEFTDQLVTGLEEAANIATAGMDIQKNVGEFNPMLDELYQAPVYGFYSGTPMYSVFNFATGFNSAVYDYSYNLTIDPSMYDDYSAYYVKDLADVYWLK